MLVTPPTGAQAQADALERLRARVRAASPLLTQQRAAVSLAEARRQRAGLAEPITLSAEVEEVPNGINLVQAEGVRVDASRALVPSARRVAERALADQDIARARLALDVVERALDVQTDRLVAVSAGASAIAGRYAAEDSLLAAAEEAVRSRFAVGDARFVEVLRLRTERLRVQTALQRARTDAQLARGQLLRLATGTYDTPASDTVGVGQTIAAAVADERARVASGALAAVPPLDSLLAQSAAVRLATQDVTRARAAQALVRASQRPNITPTVGLQRFATERGYSFGPTLGISMTLPQTARGRAAAETSIAAREVALAEATARAAGARIGAALAAAAERYDAARARIATFDAALLRGAREEREAALAAYRTGGLSLLELLDFERALAQAEITRMESRIEAIDARADLYLIALGADDLLQGDASATHQENDR